jgi:tetratricopeptide (TPR) repeat protein
MQIALTEGRAMIENRREHWQRASSVLTVSLCLFQLLHCVRSLCAADPTSRGQGAPSKHPTAALLSRDDSVLTPLVEQRLLANVDATWLDRNAFQSLLAEQKLQALVAASAGTERAKIGKILKADLLVVLTTSAKPKSATIIVWKTDHGLRLAARTIPLGEKPETDAATVTEIVSRAVARHADSIKEIVAVPPLVSGNLTYEYNHLQGAYAALLAEALDDQPGILLVELAEAEAIGKELTSAGKESTVRRRLPIYLLGEFRHQGTGSDARVRLQIRAMRGEQKLGQRESTLRPDEVPALLRSAARELIGGKQDAEKTPNAKVEARQLTDRAVDLQQLGQWQESMSLLEAALLLEPSEERHYRAVVACSHLSRNYGYWSKMTEDDKKAGRRFYIRGLEHLEEFFSTAGKVEGAHFGGPREFAFTYPSFDFKLYLTEPSNSDVVAAVEKEREILLRILHQRVRGGYRDEAWIFSTLRHSLTKQEYFDLMYRLSVDFKGLPGQKERLQLYLLTSFGAKGCRCPEGDKLIARLEKSDDAELRGLGAWLRMERDQDQRAMGPRAIADGPRSIPTSQAAQFKVVEFPVIDRPSKGRILSGFLGCIPAGGNREIVWDHNHIYKVESKEGLEELWSTDDSAIVFGAVYDGRFVWATVHRGFSPPFLVVIDPDRGTVRQFAEGSGLPIQPQEKLPPHTYQDIRVAPISLGCACVAGGFGRGWIAIVKFDPSAERSLLVDVIHEAPHTWDGANTQFALDPAAAFQPQSMAVLTDWTAGGPGKQFRILLGRTDGNHTDIGSHPLLIDPAAKSVHVVSSGHHFSFAAAWPLSHGSFGIHKGSVYFRAFASDRRSHHLYRLGFPELEPVSVMDEPPEGCVVSYDGNLYIAGEKWWRLHDDGRLDDFGVTPWTYDINSVDSRWVGESRNDKQPRPLINAIFSSRYFGLLATTHNRSASNQNDKWVTYLVSLREDKAKPAVPIVTAASQREAEQQKAVSAASEAINRNPKDAAAWDRRARTYQHFGEWKKAEADATEALRLDPKFAVAYNTRAVCRLYLGDVEKGTADLTEAIQLNPKFAEAYNNRGVVRFRKGDMEGAEADFTAAIGANPKFALAYCDRGAMYKKKREFDRAIADYTEAIRISPTYAPSFTGRADVYENQGETKLAWKDRAEERCITAAELLTQGNLSGAEACLDRALKLDPNHAQAYHQRGVLRTKKGDAAGAAEDFAKAAQLDPSSPGDSPAPAPKKASNDLEKNPK